MLVGGGFNQPMFEPALVSTRPGSNPRLDSAALVMHKDPAEFAHRDGRFGEALESVTGAVAGVDLRGVPAFVVVDENDVMPFDSVTDSHDALPSNY